MYIRPSMWSNIAIGLTVVGALLGIWAVDLAIKGVGWEPIIGAASVLFDIAGVIIALRKKLRSLKRKILRHF